MATSYFIYKASARWNEAILLLIRSKPHPDPIADWYFYSEPVQVLNLTWQGF